MAGAAMPIWYRHCSTCHDYAWISARIMYRLAHM